MCLCVCVCVSVCVYIKATVNNWGFTDGYVRVGWGCACMKGWSVLSNDDKVLLQTFLTTFDLSSEKQKKKKKRRRRRTIQFTRLISPIQNTQHVCNPWIPDSYPIWVGFKIQGQQIAEDHSTSGQGWKINASWESAGEPGLVRMYFTPAHMADRQCHLLLHILNLSPFNSPVTSNVCIRAW